MENRDYTKVLEKHFGANLVSEKIGKDSKVTIVDFYVFCREVDEDIQGIAEGLFKCPNSTRL